MLRFVLRRLAFILPVLLVVHFLGYAYAHLARPGVAARNPYFASLVSPAPLLPTYIAYLQGAARLDFGQMPRGQRDLALQRREVAAPPGEQVAAAVGKAAAVSLGLLALALTLSAVLGLALGLRAVRAASPGVSPWLTSLATVGLAMPSFYIGSLLILGTLSYIIWGPGAGAPLPVQGFGWDNHLLLPTLALMVRPTAQIAQVTSGLLAGELSKMYVVAARSVGHSWRAIHRKHALRNILVPVIGTVFGSLRLMVGELVVVEWLFSWPGLGRLLAWTLVPSLSSSPAQQALFLDPPVLAALLTVLAALFLTADFVSALLARASDPRLGVSGEGLVDV